MLCLFGFFCLANGASQSVFSACSGCSGNRALFCIPLIILYTRFNTLPTRVFCYLAVSLLNFLALPFCWKDNMEELLLTYCSGTAAYQLTNKLYPLLQLLLGYNDLETISLFHIGPNQMVGLDALFCVLPCVLLAPCPNFFSKESPVSQPTHCPECEPALL